jgi:hypothetical protein
LIDGVSNATMTARGRRHAYFFFFLLLVSSCYSFVDFWGLRVGTSCPFRTSCPFHGKRSLLSPRLSTTGTDTVDETDPNNTDTNNSEPPISTFESLVRNVMGRSDYKFGDLTKEAVSTTTHAVEDLAKKTHLVDQDYQFGVSTM